MSKSYSINLWNTNLVFNYYVITYHQAYVRVKNLRAKILEINWLTLLSIFNWNI